MDRAIDPPTPKIGPKRDYVVPIPRVTDALGQSLRRAFACPAESLDLDRLMLKLDAIG